jgi:hypothetical protein
MHKRLVGSAIALILTAPVSVALTTTAADAASLYYSSCDNLHKDYRHGVAKSRRAAMKQVKQGYGRPAYGKRAKRVYWENESRLDRDGDGTACEA